MQNLIRTAVVSGALFVAIVGQGQAAITIGQTFEPTDNCSPRTRVQSSSPGGHYAAPFAGVITSWSFRSSSAGGSSPMKLKVARHAGGDDFTIVGESVYQNIPDADAFFTFPVRIPVHAGDVLGVVTQPASVFLCARAAMGYVMHESTFGVDVPLGTTAAFTPRSDQQLGVSAQLEADCDNDGFGDETQDADTASCNPPATAVCHGTTIASTNGSEGDDDLLGTINADAIFGLGGNDELDGVDGDDCVDGNNGDDRASGGADNDVVKGGDGRDKVRGLGGKDRLKGQGGVDRVNGGEGSDKLSGGPGDDKLRGGAAKDKYKGNAGDDDLNAVDAKRDRVNCGGGDDKAVVDEIDRVSDNCETVREVEKDD